MISEPQMDSYVNEIVKARNKLCDILTDATRVTDGLITFKVVDHCIHAHLKVGTNMPRAVEQRCDVVTRDLADGRIEWLKNRDNPLPTPTDPAL
jgi:hypothetical protein